MRLAVTRALCIGLVIGVAGFAAAAEKIYDVSTATIVSPSATRGADRAIEAWGFEAGEGFSPGYIEGQAGWTTFASSVTEGHIDTANPNDGTQHLRISQDPAVAAGTNIGAFSPEVSDAVVDTSIVVIFVNIGATGGADYDVVPQAPSQALLTARVKFSSAGDILVLDDLGAGLTFVDTGVDYIPGSYIPLQINVDPVANTIEFSYNVASIYSSVAGVFAGTLVEQLVILSDNNNSGESADFDSLVINRGEVPVELQSLSIE